MAAQRQTINTAITIKHPVTRRPMGEIVRVEVIVLPPATYTGAPVRILKTLVDSDGVRYNIKPLPVGGARLIIPPKHGSDLDFALDLPFAYGAAIVNRLDDVCDAVDAWY